MPDAVLTRAVRVSAVQKMPRAQKRPLFSSREWARALRRPRSGETLAARLAAKIGVLCFFRSLGYSGALLPGRIEVLNEKNGRPRLVIRDPEGRRFLRARGAKLHLSIAHTRLWGAAALLVKLK